MIYLLCLEIVEMEATPKNEG